MSKSFKIILAVRFLGYLLFFSGLISFIFMLGPFVQAEVGYRADKILRVKRTVPKIITSSDQSARAGFSNIKISSTQILPVSTDFGVVIEKIGANAKVLADIDWTDEAVYTKALALGVAHARGTSFPGQGGNIYLFSHAADGPINSIRYNANFYLLKELEKGDRVIVFYQNKRFDYVVFEKMVVDPADTAYLTNQYSSEVLTLQTCFPPATLLKRLIIMAKLS